MVNDLDIFDYYLHPTCCIFTGISRLPEPNPNQLLCPEKSNFLNFA